MVASSESTSALLGLSNNLADAVERAGLSVVAVNGRQQLASSGVHWRPGVIVTADHTIDREEGITVTLPNGQTVPVTLAGRDAGTDLAILKVEGGDVPTAEIADSETLRIGHIVVAVARPGETGLSASLGTISALSGSWRTWAGGQVDQLIRPDLTLYPGFSGGPLVDAAGRVVGINTSGLSRRLTLALPTSTVNRVAEQLLTRGRIARGYLGIGMQPVRLPDSLRSSLSLEQQDALIVVSVETGGPAEKAGVLIGDILIALDGKPVADTHDVQSLLDPDRVGKPLAATVARGGTRTDVTLTVGERPRTGA
ncbi:MAG: trypsin-like peptidase domain-containing protein [Chloroflexota bacterium]